MAGSIGTVESQQEDMLINGKHVKLVSYGVRVGEPVKIIGQVDVSACPSVFGSGYIYKSFESKGRVMRLAAEGAMALTNYGGEQINVEAIQREKGEVGRGLLERPASSRDQIPPPIAPFRLQLPKIPENAAYLVGEIKKREARGEIKDARARFKLCHGLGIM